MLRQHGESHALENRRLDRFDAAEYENPFRDHTGFPLQVFRDRRRLVGHQERKTRQILDPDTAPAFGVKRIRHDDGKPIIEDGNDFQAVVPETVGLRNESEIIDRQIVRERIEDFAGIADMGGHVHCPDGVRGTRSRLRESKRDPACGRRSPRFPSVVPHPGAPAAPWPGRSWSGLPR